MVRDAQSPVSGAPGSLAIVDQSTGLRLSIVQGLLVAITTGMFVAAIGGSGFLGFIFFIAAIGLGLYAIPRTIEATKWHPAELHLATSPLALGSTTTVEFVRASKKPTGIDRSESINIELTCMESATYTVGTDTRTDTSDVYKHRENIGGAFHAGTFAARFPLQIPVERGAPTMDLGNNEISWKLEIKGDRGSLPNRTIGFILTISPELAVPESLAENIQDA